MSVKIMSLIFEYNMPDLSYKDGKETKTVKASTCKFVMLAISDHANDLGKSAYPGLTRLQSKTALSRQGVINAIYALRSNGYLDISETPSELQTNNYTINIGKLVNPVDQSTPLTRVVNPVDLKHPLTVKEEEEEKNNIFTLYEQVIGPLPGNMRTIDELKEYNEMPYEWLEQAFKLAVDANARRWAYIRTILDGWKANGYGWKPGSKNYSKPAQPSRVAVEEY